MTVDNSQISQAKSAIKKLFDVMSIKNVVHVDDEYNVTIDDLINELIGLHPEKRKRLPNIPAELAKKDLGDADILRQQLQILNEDDPETFQNLEKALNEVRRISNEISILFTDYKFYGVSPDQWKNNDSLYVQQEFINETLYLFDLNLSHADPEGGLRLIAEFLHNHDEVYCGLISNQFGPDEEYEQWLKYTSDGATYGNYKHRFALISKGHGDNYLGRVESIKRIIINEKAHDFLTKAVDCVAKAYTNSYAVLKDYDIYDLEYMIFKSSFHEGVWEFDTLVRILNILQRKELIKISKDSEDISNISKAVRNISSGSIDKDLIPTTRALELKFSEIYDEGEIINKYHLPLEIGDIFEINIGNVKSSFILLTQPCDLMVRESGKRQVEEGILVEIRNLDEPLKNAMLGYEIEEFDQTSQKYVDFRYSHTVSLSILDFAVFNKTGQCMINTQQKLNELSLINSWNFRGSKLQSKFDGVIKTQQSLDEILKKEKYNDPQLVPHLSLSRTLAISPAIADNSVTYPIFRIKRLRQPLAGSILTRFAASKARDAFEHDFTKST